MWPFDREVFGHLEGRARNCRSREGRLRCTERFWELPMAIATGARIPSTSRGALAKDGGFTLGDILTILRRRWLLILMDGLCGVGLAIVASTWMPRRYEAAAGVAVDSTPR